MPCLTRFLVFLWPGRVHVVWRAIARPGVRPDCANPGVRPALLVHGGHPKGCVEREEAAGVQLEERQAMPERPRLRCEAATAVSDSSLTHP